MGESKYYTRAERQALPERTVHVNGVERTIPPAQTGLLMDYQPNDSEPGRDSRKGNGFFRITYYEITNGREFMGTSPDRMLEIESEFHPAPAEACFHLRYEDLQTLIDGLTKLTEFPIKNNQKCLTFIRYVKQWLRGCWRRTDSKL